MLSIWNDDPVSPFSLRYFSTASSYPLLAPILMTSLGTASQFFIPHLCIITPPSSAQRTDIYILSCAPEGGKRARNGSQYHIHLWHSLSMGQPEQQAPHELLWFFLSRISFTTTATTISNTIAPTISEARFSDIKLSIMPELLSRFCRWRFHTCSSGKSCRAWLPALQSPQPFRE